MHEGWMHGEEVRWAGIVTPSGILNEGFAHFPLTSALTHYPAALKNNPIQVKRVNRETEDAARVGKICQNLPLIPRVCGKAFRPSPLVSTGPISDFPTSFAAMLGCSLGYNECMEDRSEPIWLNDCAKTPDMIGASFRFHEKVCFLVSLHHILFWIQTNRALPCLVLNRLTLNTQLLSWIWTFQQIKADCQVPSKGEQIDCFMLSMLFVLKLQQCMTLCLCTGLTDGSAFCLWSYCFSLLLVCWSLFLIFLLSCCHVIFEDGG